ncbi:MAG: MFS transporter [Planctomycetaceae bacterium]|nr:MFS transporter [Planctomycetaceae bacterium]
MEEPNERGDHPRGDSASRRLSRFAPFDRVLKSLPAKRRPGLYYETLANLGSGGIVRLFPVTLVILETILDADLVYQMIIASVFYGANLTSPFFTWLSGHLRVRWLVIGPLFLMAAALFAIIINPQSPLFLTILVSLVLGLRVSARVGEMNMFRLLYPDEHVSTAVGWTRSMAAMSGLILTLAAWAWLEWAPEYYWGLLWFAGVGMLFGGWAYTRIPTHRKNFYSGTRSRSPFPAFFRGMKEFWGDKRFLRYELAFFIVGIGNQMAMYLVPNVLNEQMGVSRTHINLIAVVIPSVTIILTAPLWGRFLANQTPMLARGVFSVMQTFTFSLYAYGGVTQSLWPFYLGTLIHACSVAGGSINWLTGSFYFAGPERSALYSGIHVFLTGIRGVMVPIIGRMIYIDGPTGFGFDGLGQGAWIFTICVGFSVVAAAIFFYAQILELKLRPSRSSV